MRRLPMLLSLTAILLLPGCLDGQQEPAEAPLDLAAHVAAITGELPCDAAVDETTSANLMELAHAALDANGASRLGELDLAGNIALAARYSTGGVSIADITDPLQPKELATWDPENSMRGLDVKATPDGTGALLASDDGIRLLDIRDPTAPVLEAHQVFDAPQAHMITVFEVDGQAYVAAAKGNGQDLPIYAIEGEPGQRTFTLVSSPHVTPWSRTTGQFNEEDLTRTHDAFFFHDPILDAPMLWLANPWDGIVALDVSDPANPEILATIPNVKPQYTHTVQTIVLDEQRITISVSEVGLNTLKVFDTTNLALPILLAEWSVPVAAQAQHNLQVVPPYVYVAHYAEGVFVLALDDLLDGIASPIARLASHSDGGAVSFGGTWDVVLNNGILYVSDNGFRAAAFGCITPGDQAMTSLG